MTGKQDAGVSGRHWMGPRRARGGAAVGERIAAKPVDATGVNLSPARWELGFSQLGNTV